MNEKRETYNKVQEFLEGERRIFTLNFMSFQQKFYSDSSHSHPKRNLINFNWSLSNCADIYIYLNNVPCSEDDAERQKLRELIDNCKRIRALVEREFHPHEEDDDVDATSYLDMNRSRAENARGL